MVNSISLTDFSSSAPILLIAVTLLLVKVRIAYIWVSDTSPLSVHNRYYYICAYIDLHSRKVVSCYVGRNNSTQLTKRTFMDAYKDRKPKELIIHTDYGSCYSSYSFNQKLQELGVEHSYSRPHTPHDNAVAESFFNTLKREAIFLNGYPKSLRELKQLVSKYIEKYNSTRPHEHLRYSSPDEFEKEYSKNQNVDKRQK